jgi:protein-disulfide isomerase
MYRWFLIRTIIWCNCLSANESPIHTKHPVFRTGADEAPIEVIEFCSMYFPACECFHNQEFPEITKQYIDSNKIKWVRVPFPIDMGDIYMLAYLKLLPPKKRWDADVWYKTFRETQTFQKEEELKQVLRTQLEHRYAELKGLDDISSDAIDAIIQDIHQLIDTYKLTEYPSFHIKGRGVSIGHLQKELETHCN